MSRYILIILLFISPVFSQEMVWMGKAELVGYCPCTSCGIIPKEKLPEQTASGTFARPKFTLAATRTIPFTTKIEWCEEGNRAGFVFLGVVEDRGRRFKIENGVIKIGVFFSNHSEVESFGRKYGFIRFNALSK